MSRNKLLTLPFGAAVAVAALSLLTLLAACAAPPSPTATPDIPATVAAAVQEALPTATPVPTPDLPATVAAGVQATIAAAHLTPKPSPNSPVDLATMVERVKSGVVRIDTYPGGGSGVIFETGARQEALVLTNYHVIAGVNRIGVLVNNSRTYQGRVVGYDAVRDLAVLEICCDRFQTLPFRDSQEVKPGSDVVAIGYPLGLSGSATVTRGIVSAVRYDTDYKSWVFQTDAPINSGNSGGPLLLSTGEVIGINAFSQKLDEDGVLIEGVGFAISERSIRAALPDLKRGAKVGGATTMPQPTPAPQVKWQTYVNNVYNYSVSLPADWEIDDWDKRDVFFNSPEDFADATVFVPDFYVRSANAELMDYLERIRAEPYVVFEVLHRYSAKHSGDWEVAHVRYREQSSHEYCVEENHEWLWVKGSRAYWLTLSACEHSLPEYETVFGLILESITFN